MKESFIEMKEDCISVTDYQISDMLDHISKYVMPDAIANKTCYPNDPVQTEWNNVVRKVRDILCSRVKICFSTVNGIMSACFREKQFDYIIVDEACQCTEAETTICFRKGLKSLVLVGDPAQLPSTVFAKKIEEKGYGRSLFQRLYE